MKKIELLCVLSILFFLTGCISSKQYFVAKDNKKMIENTIYELQKLETGECIAFYSVENWKSLLHWHNVGDSCLSFDLRRSNLNRIEFIRAKRILKDYSVKLEKEKVYSSTQPRVVTGVFDKFQGDFCDNQLAIKLTLLVFNEIYMDKSPFKIERMNAGNLIIGYEKNE